MSRSSREQISTLIDAFRSAADWILEGIGLVLPERWRGARRRPETMIKQAGREDVVEERSLFRARNTRPHDGPATARTRVVLPSSEIYHARITLPHRAASRVEETLRLRLGELCPIPPGEALIASRIVGRTGDGRLAIDFAVARSAAIEALIEREDARIVEVVGEARPGQPVHIFRRIVRSRPWSSYRPLAPWLTLGASLTLAFVAVDLRLDRRVAALEARSAQLVQEIKALERENGRLRADAQVAASVSRFPTPQELLDAIGRLSRDLPKGVVFERVESFGTTLRVSGFAPTGTQARIVNAAFNTSPSLRPGFERVNVETSLGAKP